MLRSREFRSSSEMSRRYADTLCRGETDLVWETYKTDTEKDGKIALCYKNTWHYRSM